MDGTGASVAVGVDESKLGRALAWSQGGYYLATGLWPILHLRSFEAVTGPRRDGRLTRSLGGLIAAVGASMMVAARRRHVSMEVRALGFGTALAVAVGRRRRPATVLPQLALMAGWFVASRRRSQVKHKVRAAEYEAVLLTV